MSPPENMIDEDLENIHATIRSRRNELGMTQEYIAYKLQISQNCYHKIESGKISLKVKTLLYLARVLEIEVVNFFR